MVELRINVPTNFTHLFDVLIKYSAGESLGQLFLPEWLKKTWADTKC